MKKHRFAVPVLRTVIGVLFVLGITLLPEWGVIKQGAESEFGRIADRFVGEFLTREGESVEEAKARLAAETAARQDAAKASVEASLERAKTETEKCVPELPTSADFGSWIARAGVEASLERARASVEAARAFESVPAPSDGKE